MLNFGKKSAIIPLLAVFLLASSISPSPALAESPAHRVAQPRAKKAGTFGQRFRSKLKKAAALSLAGVMALSALSCGPQGGPPAPADSFKAVTYNMLAADGGQGIKGIVATLKSTNADLIALQEVDKNTHRSGKVDQARHIAGELGMKYTFRSHYNYNGGEYGVALLSKHPISDVQRHAIKDSALKMLQAKVELPSGEVSAYVVHFHPFTNPLAEAPKKTENNKARAAELSKIQALVAEAKGPALVMGDFNTIGAELAANFTDACGKSDQATWPTASPKVHKGLRWLGDAGAGVRIDYIWASDKLNVHGCKVVDSNASDHRPVVAEISFDK